METQLGYNLDNATRLFRVRKTCLEMLKDRGYLVSDEDLLESRDTFISKFSEEPKRDDLTLLSQKQEDPTDQVYLCQALQRPLYFPMPATY
ncbi:hypothetical protein ABBQ32_012476 [Trebouxia sp. C0010 RCD-2024]